nr:rhodanese-like domain-containing protein [uncultured Flavobacterium sp.]
MFGFLKNIFSEGNNEELQNVIQNKAFLVDVRTPQEFAEGNVLGSVNIPLDQVPNQLSKFKNKEHIVVFCRSGNRSGQAKSILEQNGFANVTNGGTWQNIKTIVDGK